MESLLPFCADLALVEGVVGEFLGMVLGLVFSGATWFLWIGGFLGDGRSIVGGMELSLMELTGSGSNRTIPEGGDSPRFLGALGGDGDLAGDGDGDLTGDSEKDLLTNEDLEEDLCLDFDLVGGARLVRVSCCEIGVSFGGLEDLDDDGLGGGPVSGLPRGQFV